ncbi:MAG TPA: glycosyltransferase family 2 protein [Candidatus Acidoferrum sp.]|nr:glycosyltransferase family 2 protein [Candidatus Acidoferrum sp.]
MSKALVTALVDTYNHEKYIEQALISVLEQGLSAAELEIVVVDDGSTDGTASVVEKFGLRVKLVRKKNGGQASAFNAGFAASCGQIVAILDGDDWWAKGKLTTVVEALEKNPEVSAIGHGYYEFHEKTKERKVRAPAARQVINLATAESTQAAIPAWRFLLMGALTVRRKVLQRIMPLAEEMVFMADTAIQAAAMAMGTLVLEEPLFYYRYHAQNLYAIEPKNAERLRRKYEMTELVHAHVYRMLIELGVPSESASMLLSGTWLDAKRWRLHTFGGSRLEAFQTEMEAFHASFKNPSAGYRLFKYLIVGAATLLLPPQHFYKLRDWYAERQLGRYRRQLFGDDVTAPRLREDSSEK